MDATTARQRLVKFCGREGDRLLARQACRRGGSYVQAYGKSVALKECQRYYADQGACERGVNEYVRLTVGLGGTKKRRR